MGSTEEPADKDSEPTEPTPLARAFGAGAGHAKAAKVAGVEVLADIVGGILDDPFQSEITRQGGAMDSMIDTTHTAWHEVTSAAHHLGGTEHESTAEHELHSTIHDHTDQHGHVGDAPHDHPVHPPDHPHHDPHH